MRRRDKAAGKAAKQRSKASFRHNALKAAPSRGPVADPNEKIALLERRLNESLEQQTATSEVLKVISRSAFDLLIYPLAILADERTDAGAFRQAFSIQNTVRERLAGHHENHENHNCNEVVSAFHLNAPRVARIAMFERRKFNAADRAGCSDKGAPSTPR